jgi:hypothetical protein
VSLEGHFGLMPRRHAPGRELSTAAQIAKVTICRCCRLACRSVLASCIAALSPSGYWQAPAARPALQKSPSRPSNRLQDGFCRVAIEPALLLSRPILDAGLDRCTGGGAESVRAEIRHRRHDCKPGRLRQAPVISDRREFCCCRPVRLHEVILLWEYSSPARRKKEENGTGQEDWPDRPSARPSCLVPVVKPERPCGCHKRSHNTQTGTLE